LLLGIERSNTRHRAKDFFAPDFVLQLRFANDGRLQIRADATSRWYKAKYPDSFFQASSDGTSVLTNQARSFWARQTLLTVGASLLFDR